MQFFVLGIDGPGFGVDDDLNEAHQAYMDRSADVLVARGPTRSADGGHHTGSVHVVELPDAAEAARFAEEEPFARSGCYSTIEVTQIVACLDDTMWDRPPAQPGGASALVRATFPPGLGTAEGLAGSLRPLVERSGTSRWIYVGVTRSDTGNAGGLVALADDTTADVHGWVTALLRTVGITDSGVTSQPWSRGGARPDNGVRRQGEGSCRTVSGASR